MFICGNCRGASLLHTQFPPTHHHTPTHTSQAAVNQSNMDDDALEELSFAREPRSRETTTLTRASIVDQLPKFSEWAAGRQSSLDADTVSKHVRQMVDVSVLGEYSRRVILIFSVILKVHV